MRVNLVDDETISPFLSKTLHSTALVLLDASDQITRATASDSSDEEADVNVYFTPAAFDEDTTTEVAVIVTREYPLDSRAGEALLDRADRIAVTTRAFQEEVYDLVGVLAPLVSLGDIETVDKFITREGLHE